MSPCSATTNGIEYSETFVWGHPPSPLMALTGPVELPSETFAWAHALPLPMVLNGPIAGGTAG
jgi:hypothetical protein